MSLETELFGDGWEARPSKQIPVGDSVECDVCGEDYTRRSDSGGFLFGSYAYCPSCAAGSLGNIRRCREEHLIGERCRPDESFADFVRRMRGPDAFIQITGYHPKRPS